MKKIALIGVLALVVIGSVLAAGCTSTQTTSTSDDQIVGAWIKDDGTAALAIGVTNTGTYLVQTDESNLDSIPITWKKNSDGTYTLISENAKATITLDTLKGQFTTDSGSVFVKQTSDTSGSFLKYITFENIGKVVVKIWNSMFGKDKDLGGGFTGSSSHF